jgi:hypothetical protein
MLCEVLERLNQLLPVRVVTDCRPAPGYLIFVNRVDVRLLPRDCRLSDTDVVDVVPVNHPG